ncbi:hypothetical protein [Sphingomonas sp.]|uniref:hypothetical protein n=2 Tax=unclassified Sphingomonas TaxID=196159 RepID=UPI00257B28DA|nr:hypothetical protein [Sphingomonas sp.]
MTDRQILTEKKSPERIAFEHYIRTGRRLSPQGEPEVELKFNPYHDPRNGRFTFAPGGPRSLSDVIISDGHRGERRVSRSTAAAAAPEAPAASADSPQAGSLTDAVYRPDKTAPAIQSAQYRPNFRGRRGDNGGPSLNDPLTLDHVFPALRNSPGGSLIALADNIFDLTGPASRATTPVMENHINALIQQIKGVDPSFRLESLGFPKTLKGQGNLLRQLLFDRAAAVYRMKNDVRLLQVEMVRVMQETADSAYVEARARFDAGRLLPRLSREEAIGNYIDQAVRHELRKNLDLRGIDYSKGQIIRIIGREYDRSLPDPKYKIPDARVDRAAFDVSLTRKTLATPQIRGFFNSDFKPTIVIIVRPSQLGQGHTYAILRPGE